MEQNQENKVDDHQDQGTNGSSDSKQSNQTDDGEVDASRCLLQSTGVDETLGVDRGIEHEQHVVTISQIDQIKANGCKAQDQWCYDRVSDCYQAVSWAISPAKSSPLTNDSEERINWENGAPTKSRETGKSFIHLPWRCIEEFAQDPVQYHPNQLQHRTRANG